MTPTSTADRWSAMEASLLARLPEFSITRLADTTGLDVLATPTASVTKPGTSDVIWVYSGKGTTRAQARVTAIMECLERTGALWSAEVPVILESEDVLSRTHVVWGPERFTYRRRPGLTPSDPILWIEAIGLRGPATVMVPADVCFNGARPPHLAPSPFLLGSSNGLAAAVTLDDALRHGLLEVIERDVVSRIEVQASHFGYRFLAAAAEAFRLSPAVLDDFSDDMQHGRTILPGTLPADSLDLVRRYQKAGLDVVIKELPNDFGLPCFAACAVEEHDLGRYLGCAGYAVRPTSSAAVKAALLELAQTRATDLQGAREDRAEAEKQRLDRRPRNHWLATRGATAVPFEPRSENADLPAILDRCEAAGLDNLAYVRFPAWPGVTVVRIVAPMAETWHVTGGWSEIGPRLRHVMGQ